MGFRIGKKVLLAALYVLASVAPAYADDAPSGEPAQHITPVVSSIVQRTKTLSAVWTRTVRVTGVTSIASSPDGRTFVIQNKQRAYLLRTSDGTRLLTIALAEYGSVSLGNAVAATTNDRGGYDVYRSADGARIWGQRSSNDFLQLGVGPDVVYVSTEGGLSAYDALTGRRRWYQDACRLARIEDTLPNEVLVTSNFCGEPGQNIVSLRNSKTGDEYFTRGAESVYLGEVDGAIVLQDKSGGDLIAPEDYSPAEVVTIAAKGGRQYNETIYRPDPATQAKKFDMQAATNLLVSRNDVLVQLDKTLFLYARDTQPPAAPIAFSIDSMLIDGPNALVVRDRILYRMDGIGPRTTLTPLSGTIEGTPIAFAPYVVYNERGTWYAVDPDDGKTRLRLATNCPKAAITNVENGFAFACSHGSAVTASVWRVGQTPSRDAVLRIAGQQTALAAPTPVPTLQPVSEDPISIHVPLDQTVSDLKPRTLSPAVRSLTATIDHLPDGRTIDLTVANSDCKPDGNGLTCAITLPIVSGKHSLTLQFYDARNGAGQLLSRGDLSYDREDASPRVLDIALHGVAKKVSISETASLRSGHAQNVDLQILEIDADGYPILNGSDYDTPVLVTIMPRGKSSLSRATLMSRKQSVTLHYDGTPASDLIVTATIPGVDTQTLSIPIAARP